MGACRMYSQLKVALRVNCDPGQRIPDMFYGGYFRDPDGNKAVFFQFG
jgi:hypothetical protein